MNANEVIQLLKCCADIDFCPADCPGQNMKDCVTVMHGEAARLLEAALADIKKAAPCAICAHHGTPECYFRQRGMFCRELPNGGKFEWRGLHPERKENENGQ